MSKFTPPESYKAAAVTKKNVIELVDIKWKDPGPGQVVVKVEACGVCRRCAYIHPSISPPPPPSTVLRY